MSTAVVPGSLSSVAQANGISLAQAFLDCEIMAVVDVSGSMLSRDGRGGKTRWEVAQDELTKLQGSHPGKVGLIAFSDRAEFQPGGMLPTVGMLGGSTDLAGALRYASIVDGTVRYVVISDGWPDDEADALSVAAGMQSDIDCIYTGPEGDRSGAEFLVRLARRKGGRFVRASSADLLADRIAALLPAGR